MEKSWMYKLGQLIFSFFNYAYLLVYKLYLNLDWSLTVYSNAAQGFADFSEDSIFLGSYKSTFELLF